MAHKQNNFSKAMNRAAKTYGKPEGYDYQRDTLYANDSCYDDSDGYDDYLKLMQEARKANGRKPVGYNYERDTLYAND